MTANSFAPAAIKQSSRLRIENNGCMSEPNIASNFDRLALRKNNLSCRLHRLESPVFFMTGGKFISRWRDIAAGCGLCSLLKAVCES